jgi:hypothetical protein
VQEGEIDFKKISGLQVTEKPCVHAAQKILPARICSHPLERLERFERFEQIIKAKR